MWGVANAKVIAHGMAYDIKTLMAPYDTNSERDITQRVSLVTQLPSTGVGQEGAHELSHV